MTKLRFAVPFAIVAATLMLASCGPQPVARAAPSGVTAVDGGGEAYMRNMPRGLSNFPYHTNN